VDLRREGRENLGIGKSSMRVGAARNAAAPAFVEPIGRAVHPGRATARSEEVAR
jgi:hypothetical protein